MGLRGLEVQGATPSERQLNQEEFEERISNQIDDSDIVAARKRTAENLKLIETTLTERIGAEETESQLSELLKLPKDELSDTINDLADDIKIEGLKKTDPSFSAQSAAIRGAGRGLTLGLSNEIASLLESIGTATSKSLSEGTPFSPEVRKEFDRLSERTRLLDKAFPAASIGADIASSFAPQGLSAKFFIKGTKIGEKALTKFLFKQGGRPGLIRKPIAGAAEAAVGGATVEGLRGLIQDKNIKEAATRAKRGAIGGAIVGGGITAIRSGAKFAADLTEETIELVSGVAADDLKKFFNRASEIRKAAGQGVEISKELIKKLRGRLPKDTVKFLERREAVGAEAFELAGEDILESLPEAIRAEKFLVDIPNISIKPLLAQLRKGVKGFTKSAQSARKSLNRTANDIEKEFGDNVTAEQMLDIKRQLQKEAFEGVKQVEVGDLIGGLRGAASLARKQLITAARSAQKKSAIKGRVNEEEAARSGRLGQFLKLQDEAAAKVKVFNEVKEIIGTKPSKFGERAERFIANLFGKNKAAQQEKLKELDSKFGTDFFQRSEDAAIAARIGLKETGEIPILPGGGLRKALITFGSLGIGMTSGSAPLALAIVIGGSPKTSSWLLGTSSKIGKVVDVVTGNPKALERLSKNVNVNKAVRNIATRIKSINDEFGTNATADALDVLARTPAFVGFVSGFDNELKRLGVKIEKFVTEQEQPEPGIPELGGR